MRWKDEGIVIATQRYGDRNLILSLLTKEHGKCRGLVRLTDSRNYKFQVSNMLSLEWSSKLAESLGFLKCELIESPLHHFFRDSLKSIAIISFFSLLERTLSEGESCNKLYSNLIKFINLIKQNSQTWQGHYLNLELLLLAQLGFKLDLSKCAITGAKENLEFISPKTGRAVSKKVGESYKDKLLPFPQMLYDVYNNNLQNRYSYSEFKIGLKITGYFLKKYPFFQLNVKFPELRHFMLEI